MSVIWDRPFRLIFAFNSGTENQAVSNRCQRRSRRRLLGGSSDIFGAKPAFVARGGNDDEGVSDVEGVSKGTNPLKSDASGRPAD